MARPVIALLSDFGLRDHYAGTMKGVILGICPDATLVDITHDVPPHDVLAGALELAAAYRYFPVGTIFVAVVDPGVGSTRRGIAADSGEYRFVAPDNGVLTLVFDDHAPKRVVELTERRYARPTVSRTFEGRDRFAPAAAWLAKGIELAALGRNAAGVHRLDVPRPIVGDGSIEGQVLRVDRFGNLITNIDRRTFDRMAGPGLEIRVGSHVVSKVVSTYADLNADEICALFGSTDHLEIAANGASAAARLDLGRGAAVHIAQRA
jgi:S-adenosylmethionine hydrolase